MSGSRSRILGTIRASRGPGDTIPPAAMSRLRPARAQGERAVLVERFVDMAGFAGATVSRAAGGGDVPGAVAAFLSRNELGEALVLAPDPVLSALPWYERPRLVVHRRLPDADDRVSVTTAICGVAETGTVLVRSGPGLANALHFLVEAHVVVLDAADIVGGYEDGWARLVAAAPDDDPSITSVRPECRPPGGRRIEGLEPHHRAASSFDTRLAGAAQDERNGTISAGSPVTGGGALPRVATFITGPSRTADIEKTPQIGVHGPKRLHIVLVDGEKT